MSTKTVTIGGETLPITGSDVDPYFQSIEAFAAELTPLRRFVASHVGSDLILDVGANIGLTSLAMSLAAPTSRIVAFEPAPANIAFFEMNTRGRANIQLVRCGVGDAPGNLDFLVTPAGANCHVATAEYEYASIPDFHPLRVPITTLDAYSEQSAKDAKVALVKIDVEGFEPNVLAGARRLLAKWRPIVWMEFNSVTLNVAQGYSPMAFARVLFDCFEIFRVSVDGALDPIPGPGALVHDNMTLRRSIEDIVMLPRPGISIPDVQSMTLPRSVSEELRLLRRP